MRLFTGLAVPPPVLKNLEAVLADIQTELQPLARLKWSPPQNLHITTKFIGEWPESRLNELTGALARIPRSGAFPLELRGFGLLPDPRRPRIFHAAVHAGPALHALAAATDRALSALGCAREPRAYQPHLTLARIPDDNTTQLRDKIATMTNSDFGHFLATEFHLYRSQPGTRNSVYTKLATFPLSPPATEPNATKLSTTKLSAPEPGAPEPTAAEPNA